MFVEAWIFLGWIKFLGFIVAAAGTMVGFRYMNFEFDYYRMVRAGIFAALFFAISIFGIPYEATSIRFVLSGVAGLLFGWIAFPCYLASIICLTHFMAFDSFVNIGANTVFTALPAVLAYYIFGSQLRKRLIVAVPMAFLCGFTAVYATGIFTAAALLLHDSASFLPLSRSVLLAYVPIGIIEGLVTAGFRFGLGKRYLRLAAD